MNNKNIRNIAIIEMCIRDSVCAVGGNDADLGYNNCSNASGVCPLVSLKSSFQLEIEQ